MTQLELNKMSPNIQEAMAAEAHAVWADWMRYMFSKSVLNGFAGSANIPAELVTRWARQMDTPYEQLSENEKKSDREIADRYLKVILETPER